MPRIIKIGRSNKNTIIVDIEHRKISREHAEIIKIGEEEYLIKDLNSTHGTFVNDNRIKQTQLTKDCKLQLADFEIDIDSLLLKIDSVDFNKQIEYTKILKQKEILAKFDKLENIYEQYKKDKRKIERGGGLKKTGLRAVLALIPFIGNAIGIMLGHTIDVRKQLDDLNEQFKIDYVCPICYKFFGFIEPFENIKKRGYCGRGRCNAKWNTH